jgi:hypothetical protein
MIFERKGRRKNQKEKIMEVANNKDLAKFY